MANVNNLQFFLARAEQASRDAEAATLSNVRERCRRSEAAWAQLADKAARTQERRLQQSEDRKATSQTNDENH